MNGKAKDYWHQDGLGSVVANTGSNGAIKGKYTYAAFGSSNSQTGAPFLYAGMRVDAETGTYYARARAYNPALGRFLQSDPIGPDGGINLYAYVHNDPLNRVDPMGTLDFGASLSDSSLEQLATSIANPFADMLFTPVHYFGTTLPTATGQLLDACGETCGPGTFMAMEQSGFAPEMAVGAAGYLSTSLMRTFSKLGGAAQVEQEIAFGLDVRAYEHAFRHVDAEFGLDHADVMQAIKNDLGPRLPISDQYIGNVNVNGIGLEYRAYPVDGGTINVGRITGQ